MGHLQHRDGSASRRNRRSEIRERSSVLHPGNWLPVREDPPGSGHGRCGTAAIRGIRRTRLYECSSRTRRRPSNVSQRSMGRSPPRAGSAVAKPILCAFKAAECGGGGGENAQRVQNAPRFEPGRGISSTVETAQMTGGRSQQTNEEVAMADRVDRLLDDLPRQSRSHRPDVGRLIDESGGRNADALNSLDSSADAPRRVSLGVRMLSPNSTIERSGRAVSHPRSNGTTPGCDCIWLRECAFDAAHLEARTPMERFPAFQRGGPAAADTYSDFARSRSTNF